MSYRHRSWVGRRIRQCRVSSGLTQVELAERIEAHQTSISNWEAGKTDIAIRFQHPLAKALGVPWDVLYEQPPEGWQPPPEHDEQVAA